MSETARPARTELLHRLRRIEGQMRGLQRMVEEERDCAEVVTQIAAARAALDRLGHRVIALNLEQCLAGVPLDGRGEVAVERSLAALARLRS